jgi:methionine-rich copper-binding protein CopC
MHRATIRSLGACLALVSAAVLGLQVTGPASAHDYLVGSSPEQGATLASAPDQVRLDFNTSIGERFAQVAVVDGDGTTYQQGDPVVDGPSVVQAVASIPSGVEITISYRVVSSDGHPIGGTVPFTVAQAGTEETPQTNDAAATDEATPVPATPLAADTATATDTSSAAPWLIAGSVALLVAAVAGILRRARSRP